MINDFGEGICADEVHEEEGLEDGVAELWCLLQQRRRRRRIVGDEGLHLAQHLQQLLRRQRAQCSRNSIRASQPLWRINTLWEWWKNNVRLGDLWRHIPRWWSRNAVYESWELAEGV